MTPKDKTMINACYKCTFRGTIPGNCHSRCTHPTPFNINVTGNKYGMEQGWFFYPFNFDPTWLITCDGFEDKNNKIN